jgi:hypothetical protein
MEESGLTSRSVVAGFMGSIAVLVRNSEPHDISDVDTMYIITLQCILLAAFIYATTPSLLHIGRRLQTGYLAPIIDERNTMAGSIGSYARRAAARAEQDSFALRQMGSSRNITSHVSAQERSQGSGSNRMMHSEKPRKSRSMKRLNREGDASMESDSSQKIIISKTISQSSMIISPG